MGRPGMAGKYENPVTHRGGRLHIRRPDPGASGGSWPGNFTGEVASPSSSSLTSACARGLAGIASHGQNPFGLKMVQNDPVRGPQVLGNFLGFWSSK